MKSAAPTSSDANRFQATAEGIRQTQAIERLKDFKDGTVVPIPIHLIQRSENIRSKIESNEDREAFNQLLASIKEVGLLHHPVVTISGDSIVCVAGHRRLAALEKLGEAKAPCVLRKFKSLDLKQVAQLLENTARQKLHPFDIGEQLVRMRDAGYNQSKLQELMGKDRKTIGRLQKLVDWPKDAKELVFANPLKLKTGVLLQIASRDLSQEDILCELRKRCGLEKKQKSKGPTPAQQRNLTKCESFLLKHAASQEQKEFLMRALREMGLIARNPQASEANISNREAERVVKNTRRNWTTQAFTDSTPT